MKGSAEVCHCGNDEVLEAATAAEGEEGDGDDMLRGTMPGLFGEKPGNIEGSGFEV